MNSLFLIRLKLPILKKGPLYLLLSPLLLAIITSCNKPPLEKKVAGGIHLNITQDPITLDPRKGGDYTSSTIQFLLFEGLIRMSSDSTPIPAIAESFKISKDNLTYTFYLRKAKWSNGATITADDFSQTWRAILDPNFPSPNSHLLFPILNAEKAKKGLVPIDQVGVYTIDDHTLEVKLESPTPYFLELISFCVFSPICQDYAKKDNNWANRSPSEFICNGPYKIAKRTIGNEIILEKNPYYWDCESVDLEQITFSIVDNETTALNMFHNNQLDMIGSPFTSIPVDAVPNLLEKGMIHTAEIAATTVCCFNLDRFPFTNKNIRKAFAYAINRKEIVDNITQMGEVTGMKLLPENLLPGQGTPLFVDGDDKTAQMHLKMGLDELGISLKDLPKLTFLHPSSGISLKVAQAIQEQWRKALGVRVELTGFEYKVFLDKLGKKDFCIGQCIWIPQYHDPMNILDRFKCKQNTKNYSGFENKEYRNLVDGSLLFTSKEERFAELLKAVAIINEQVPFTALYHWKNPYMQKSYVKNLTLTPEGFFCLTKVKIDKEGIPVNRPSGSNNYQ